MPFFYCRRCSGLMSVDPATGVTWPAGPGLTSSDSLADTMSDFLSSRRFYRRLLADTLCDLWRLPTRILRRLARRVGLIWSGGARFRSTSRSGIPMTLSLRWLSTRSLRRLVRRGGLIWRGEARFSSASCSGIPVTLSFQSRRRCLERNPCRCPLLLRQDHQSPKR